MAEAEIKTVARLRLHYFDGVPNVGDQFNRPLIQALTNGMSPKHYTSGQQGHLLACGSMLEHANASSYIWGTGYMFEDSQPRNLAADRVFAVRGYLTLQKLRSAGILCKNTALGDPGYLAVELGIASVLDDQQKDYALGLVPHYVDRDHPWCRQILQQDDVLDLDVTQPPEVFLANMARCQIIVSSSLHGLIFAEALGIPNLWLELGDRVLGRGFKFRDWFSLAAQPQHEPYLPKPTDGWRDVADRASLHTMAIDRHGLRASFPLAHVKDMSTVDC
jgi:pyruvyltransferase